MTFRRLGLFLVCLGAIVGVLALRSAAPAQEVAVGGTSGTGVPAVTDAALRTAGGERTIRIGSLTTGESQSFPLEVYVSRVLAGEGEPNAPEAARQALAIAIRTYALANEGRHRRDGYDLCDTTHCQVLRASTAASRMAALATAGQVLLYDGRPAELFYSASCGRSSEDAADVWPGASYPYLQARPDDVHENDVDWTLDLSYAELTRLLQRAGFSGVLRGLDVGRRSASGRAAQVRLVGMDPSTMPGDQFRGAIGATRLRSTAFTMASGTDSVRFTGRGYGHGVGMCVIGAGRRAARGETAAAILSQYYPGLSLVRFPAVEPASAGATATASVRTTAPAPITSPATVQASPSAAVTSPLRPAPASNTATVPASPGRPTGGATPPPTVLQTPDARGDETPHYVTVSVPRFGGTAADELTRQADRALAEVAARAGLTPIALRVELHQTLDSYRLATGRPWWVGSAVVGDTINLAPAAAQAGTLESALRLAIAERLVQPSLEGRPLWVRRGTARYLATGVRVPVPRRLSCPQDQELTMAATAAAQRDADERAAACVVRALDRGRDWRDIR